MGFLNNIVDIDKWRNRHFFFFDLFLLAWMPVLALWMRIDTIFFTQWDRYEQPLMAYILLSMLIRLATFYFWKLYQRYWRYASIEDLVDIIYMVGISSTILIVLFFLGKRYQPDIFLLPRAVPFMESLLVLFGIGGSRLSVRWMRQQKLMLAGKIASVHRVGIMGAGDAGVMIVRELINSKQLNQEIVCFWDDDPEKRGLRVFGIPVFGDRTMISETITHYRLTQVIIAMPTAPGKTIREIVTMCEKAGAETKIIPGVYELIDGTVSISQLRNVAIEDLLRRNPIHTDQNEVAELIHRKRVLITGGGGSIGSELCRQVMRHKPSKIILLGHGENSIFEIYHELKRFLDTHQSYGTELEAVIADVRFAERIQTVFRKHKPEVVFHAAAHKHVPLMELNPAEAITNNVIGTRNLIRAAVDNQVQRFVMISTDKAVNPTNVMGASKRVAELVVHQAAVSHKVPYVAVRFGNVLGSRGSVVLTFKRQIANGGPITVTHPDMERFFMTIPEAVQLVLQAAVFGSGGEVFVLDMGEPVKIVDLAKDLIELSGFEVGNDIDIVFSGLRPGEKLYEELFLEGEEYVRTKHEKIFIAQNADSLVPDNLMGMIEELEQAGVLDERKGILQAFQAILPEFKPFDIETDKVAQE